MQIQYQIVFHDKLAKLVPFFQIRFSAFAIEIGLLSIGLVRGMMSFGEIGMGTSLVI